MFIAKELHMSLEQVMELSTLEMMMWAGFYNLEGKKRNARMKKNGSQHNRKINR